MPQNETFWNPYRLIPARDTVARRAPWTDERFRGHSGILAASIENLTPLFIGAQSSGTHHPPLLRNNRRVIPGSSLKGMLRSLAEIVGGGCFVVRNDRNSSSVPQSPVPANMATCSRVRELCIACRMFGAMERDANARVHKGKISMGDALLREDNPQCVSLQVLLSNCGVRHEPFYRSPHTGVLDGRSRKLYFHQPQRTESVGVIPENIRDRAWQIEALRPGHHFDFEIQFTSLEDDELALLLYVLHLEKKVSVTIPHDDRALHLKGPMCHKIGNAKPLGLGSCQISITRLTILAPPTQRYSSMTATGDRNLEGDALHAELDAKTAPYTQDASPTMTALRQMMVWDTQDTRDFRYPDYHWFKNPQYQGAPLKVL